MLADLESQTLAGVQTLATRYLDPDRALPVLVVPAADSAVRGRGCRRGNAAPPVKPWPRWRALNEKEWSSGTQQALR